MMPRAGDAAPMALMQLVDKAVVVEAPAADAKTETKAKRAPRKKAAAAA